MKADEANGIEYDRDAIWVTPDPSRMPHCKVCKAQGCMHFRRGFAHLLALNQDCCIPTLTTDKGVGEEASQPANADILIPASCPCHGCNEPVVRADLNRGHDKSLSFNLDPKTGEWKAEFVRYRYKRDTELVVGCSGRHKIIESPKAGRYAQLWCRTCCNCAISSKTIGNLVGCTNTAHWHTVTNRSYHEKTPFHQLAHNLLQASYNEALQARIPFEDAIGLTGQTYYKMAGEKGCEADQQPGGRKGGEGGGGGGKNGKRDRGVEGTDMHQANSGAFFPHGLASMDQHNLFRGMNGGMAGLMSPGPSQAHLQQLHGLQQGFWPHGMDPSSSGSNGHLQMMRAAVSERMAQRPRTGSAGMKPGAPGAPGVPRDASMLPSQMHLRTDGMFRGKGNSGRGDGLLTTGGMSFGVDAYNAFRGMFESSGSMGINIAASLSGGSGQIGMQQLPVPMRSAPLGLTALGSDFASRFSQPSVVQGQGEGGVDNREGEREAGSSTYKSAYADLENVPDILTNGGRL